MLPLEISQLDFVVNNKRLLHNVELKLSDTGVSIIMGHNGAGKSILLRCMHGLLEPDKGTILWAGNKASDLATRKKQSMVFQKPLMLNRSVAANIDYVLQLRGKPRHHSLQFLQSAGLEDKSTQPARSLSGGEQQRLAIARALACEPEVIFLDEPTASLDPDATLKIESQITNASDQSIKIVMVTHDIAQARRLAGDIVFVSKGTVKEHSSAELFFKQPQSIEARDYLSAYIR